MIKKMLIFLVLFTLDNLLVIFIPVQPVFGQYVIAPYVLLTGICLSCFFDEKGHVPVLSFVFGLIYDVYGANLIGLYATLFPVLTVVIKRYVVPNTPVNFISIFYVSAVAILIVETAIYTMVNVVIGSELTLIGFVQYRLMITVVFNFMLLGLLYTSLVRWFKATEI